MMKASALLSALSLSKGEMTEIAVQYRCFGHFCANEKTRRHYGKQDLRICKSIRMQGSIFQKTFRMNTVLLMNRTRSEWRWRSL